MRAFESPLTAALLLLCTACGGDETPLRYGPAEMDHSRLHPVKISGWVLATGDYLGRPSTIMPIGEHLLVLDEIGDSALHVISAADGRRVRSQGRRGAGPGEYKGATGISPDPRDRESAWVYDFALTRLTRVRPGRLDENRTDPEIITLTNDVMPVQPIWLGDSLLASLNFSPRGRLTFFGRDGELLRGAGGVPADERGTPPGVLQQAWVGQLASRPAGDRLVLVTLYADQIEIYRRDGLLQKKVRGPFHFDPRFTVDDIQGFKTMASDESMRIGYPGVATTNERIYALFSGRTREAFGAEVTFGRYLHVYDWDGNLLRVLELDKAVTAIALSPDRRLLYGVANTPEPVIMSYELPG
jgi:hypothetical protein